MATVASTMALAESEAALLYRHDHPHHHHQVVVPPPSYRYHDPQCRDGHRCECQCHHGHPTASPPTRSTDCPGLTASPEPIGSSSTRATHTVSPAGTYTATYDTRYYTSLSEPQLDACPPHRDDPALRSITLPTSPSTLSQIQQRRQESDLQRYERILRQEWEEIARRGSERSMWRNRDRDEDRTPVTPSPAQTHTRSGSQPLVQAQVQPAPTSRPRGMTAPLPPPRPTQPTPITIATSPTSTYAPVSAPTLQRTTRAGVPVSVGRPTSADAVASRPVPPPLGQPATRRSTVPVSGLEIQHAHRGHGGQRSLAPVDEGGYSQSAPGVAYAPSDNISRASFVPGDDLTSLNRRHSAASQSPASHGVASPPLPVPNDRPGLSPIPSSRSSNSAESRIASLPAATAATSSEMFFSKNNHLSLTVSPAPSKTTFRPGDKLSLTLCLGPQVSLSSYTSIRLTITGKSKVISEPPDKHVFVIESKSVHPNPDPGVEHVGMSAGRKWAFEVKVPETTKCGCERKAVPGTYADGGVEVRYKMELVGERSRFKSNCEISAPLQVATMSPTSVCEALERVQSLVATTTRDSQNTAEGSVGPSNQTVRKEGDWSVIASPSTWHPVVGQDNSVRGCELAWRIESAPNDTRDVVFRYRLALILPLGSAISSALTDVIQTARVAVWKEVTVKYTQGRQKGKGFKGHATSVKVRSQDRDQDPKVEVNNVAGRSELTLTGTIQIAKAQLMPLYTCNAEVRCGISATINTSALLLKSFRASAVLPTVVPFDYHRNRRPTSAGSIGPGSYGTLGGVMTRTSSTSDSMSATGSAAGHNGTDLSASSSLRRATARGVPIPGAVSPLTAASRGEPSSNRSGVSPFVVQNPDPTSPAIATPGTLAAVSSWLSGPQDWTASEEVLATSPPSSQLGGLGSSPPSSQRGVLASSPPSSQLGRLASSPPRSQPGVLVSPVHPSERRYPPGYTVPSPRRMSDSSDDPEMDGEILPTYEDVEQATVHDLIAAVHNLQF